MMENPNIKIPNTPLVVNLGEWIIEHPDCDSICERIDANHNYLIFAYASQKSGNQDIKKLRDERFSDKKILMGVTADGIRGLI